MVGRKEIRGLDFETLEDYFKYIVDSKINGNKRQATNLHDELSHPQKSKFLEWLLGNMSADDALEVLRYIQ